jgi:hypothetical protein
MNTEPLPALESMALLGAFIRPVIVVWILSGLWLGLSRAPLPSHRRTIVWGAVAISLIAWVAVAWTLALHGTFELAGGGLIIESDLVLVAVVLTLLVR